MESAPVPLIRWAGGKLLQYSSSTCDYYELAKQLFKAMPKSRGRRIKKDSLETNATFGVNEMAPTLT